MENLRIISSVKNEYIHLFDTTLRDGAQTQGVDFNTVDKGALACELDSIGVDYIEGGWPGANPTDDAFFNNPPTLNRATKRLAKRLARRPYCSTPPAVTTQMPP